ncbi:RHS repeat protein, partial [Micromonospora echinofusca]|nr:RHS repeat protein [Micromonospora echinofusca]
MPAQAETPAAAANLQPQQYPSVPGAAIRPSAPKAAPTNPAARVARPAPVWPAPATAVIDLTGSTGSRGTTTQVDGMPVRVSRPPAASARSGLSVPSSVRVEVLPRSSAAKAGVNGLLVRIVRDDASTAAGQVQVTIDYDRFRTAFGADWESRLRLAALPECALSTPGATGCAETPLPTSNEHRRGMVTSTVTLRPDRTSLTPSAGAIGKPGTLLALLSGPSGGAGDFAASDLAPSSSWGHGGSTGGFQWSYPMEIPDGLGGPEPELSLSYSSQSVDGRQAATNNQPGMIGEGFDYTPGFVERRYKQCSDDMTGGANNTVKTGDLCWGPDNAVMSLGGRSMELVKGANGEWHPRHEDGSKIELLTSPAFANGDDNDEYWKVTTSDGTQYWFGRHQLPGWSAGRPTTNSVLTVPVFGNHSGEPCHQATFAASECTGKKQAWRWNLDYVVDIHGNSMSLWWTKETNYYAKNKVTATPVSYDRAGYLTRIDYGSDSRDNNEYAAASPYVENTPARVEFTNDHRCLTNCTTKNATTWPDTPWDQECTASTNPCLYISPTFWSSKRLTVVTTKVWKTATSSYQPVNSWTLRHSFLDPGDGTRAGLWLEGITRRGLNATTPVVMPEVTFVGAQMNNRVDATGADWALAMNWWRIVSIRTETGGEIFVTYSNRECVAGSVMPAAVDNNKLRCYPVKWTPQGYVDPITDYFHKYVVTEIQEIDHTGGARPRLTTYEYNNPGNLPLWHHDNGDGTVPATRQSWGDWRGYPTVVTTVGEGADATKTETLYFRGMHGDRLAAGGTRNVTVQGIEGGAATDHDHFAGMPREQITWLGSTVLVAVVSDPWRSDPATATRAGTPTVESRHVAVRTTRTRTAVDGGWRRTTTTTNYDAYGMPTSVEDYGDDATTADDQCTATEYVRNITAWILTSVKRVHAWADDCATPATSVGQIISDTKFTYDNLTYGTAPAKGDITAVETITGFDGTTRQYHTVSTSTYDVYGRIDKATDIAGAETDTDYTPATGGPVTKVTTINPLGWTSSTEVDPATGATIKTTDANLRVTEATYDGLGRVTAVWLPNRNKATFPTTPSTDYSYTLSKTGPSGTTTRTINAKGGYRTTYAIIDSLGRPRQTQTLAYGGGRIITDTFYDAASGVWKSNAAYRDATGTPGLTLWSGYDADMPSQTRTLFDAAGRPTHRILLTSEGGVQVEKWRTSTTYHGDHHTTTPPAGGTTTTVWTDARGTTTKQWQHHGTNPTTAYDETRYTYHPTGQLASVTDAAGNEWSYEYDIQGRKTRAEDPDTGVTTMTYNSIGQLEEVHDSRTAVADLAYTYDTLGRVTSVREGNTSGTVRASWTYDTPAKGLTSTASRFIGGNEYKTQLVTVDAQYRPTQVRTIIPPVEGTLQGTYTTKATFLADGSPNTITYPAAGGLAEEIVTFTYDDTYALPSQLKTNYGDVTHYIT